MTDVDRPRGPFYRFFANPWVGILGSIAGIIGLPLAVYFYFASISAPNLVYYVDPARVSVVEQGTASRLSIQFDGRALTQDVTAVQIALWNRGNQAVRSDTILSPVTINTLPTAPILEVKLVKKSRDVVNLDLDQSHLNEGKLGLSWNVLEQGDGGVIQVIYAGDSNVPITATGVVIGQTQLHEMKYPGSIRSAKEQVKKESSELWTLGLLSVLVTVAFVATLVHRLKKGTLLQVDSIIDLAPPVLMMLGLVYVVYSWWGFSLPPFDLY